MEELVQAFNIFLKYTKEEFPTNCSHDELWVNVDPDLVSKEDIETLDTLGFFPSDDGFKSFKYGSC